MFVTVVKAVRCPQFESELRYSLFYSGYKSFISLGDRSGRRSYSITGSIPITGPRVGSNAELRHSFTQKMVDDFAKLSGDNNPLHVDPEFARKSFFQKPIVHGILVSSLFSTIFGRTVHGSIYVSQSLTFKRPVYVNQAIIASINVMKSDYKTKGILLTCKSNVIDDDGNIYIDGEAKVMIPHAIHHL
mmetsp:Transcript_28456/g.28785  ORF Transcript_28456/g.28785 Transcript_28456/m.28785 type:complete len:188 (+) Transcript_28456:212-775(+)